MNNLSQITKTILDLKPICQICKSSGASYIEERKAGEEPKISNLIPVCFFCKKTISWAIKNGWTGEKDEVEVSQSYFKWKDKIGQKRMLTKEEIDLIKVSQKFVIRFISSLLGRHVWYEDLPSQEFSEIEILKIKSVLKVAVSRRKKHKNFLDFVDLYGKFGHIPD